MYIKFSIWILLFSILQANSIVSYAQQPSSVTSVNVESTLRSIEAHGRNQEVLLKILIEEIKQIRITSQVTSINLYRMQLLNDSFNNQQSRVEIVSAELDLITQQIAESNEPSHLEAELEEVKEQLNQATDLPQRSALLNNYNNLKRSIETNKERLRKDREVNRIRQQSLISKLQSEKARMAEIEEKISSMQQYFEKLTDQLERKAN